MARCYLIQDPYHAYAASFIEVIYRTWGHRAVCLYTDDKLRFYQAPAFPILESDRIAASIELGDDSLETAARRLGRKFDIAGIVPFSEQTVADAAELASLLHLNWCPAPVLRRFRDKFALKEYVRTHHPQVRMNASRRVTTADDVLRRPVPERYVLKPNDGFGNSAIGMFDAGTSREELASFFAAHPTRAWLLEEFIGGTEYFVNGQVGPDGEVDVIAVFEYERRPANGRENLDHLTWRVPRESAEFAMLERYAREVVQATGLVRSPFHLEAKIDERGPCLIEIGARLAGNGNAYVCNQLHGGGLDVFRLAASHYLGSRGEPAMLDWVRYDDSELVYVHGVATDEAVVETLEGVDEVEDLPEFVGWVKKPVLGANIVPTVGLLSSPWCVLLRARTRERLRTVAHRVRGLIGWNREADTVSQVTILGRELGFKLQRRLSWELYGRPLSALRRLTA